MVDSGCSATIPASTGVVTTSRPDLVIYSDSTKHILWAELTVPLERNIVAARVRKKARYLKLVSQLRLKGWTVSPFEVEIGALGTPGSSFVRFLTCIGLPRNQAKWLRKKVGCIALRSSYFIWKCRFSRDLVMPELVKDTNLRTSHESDSERKLCTSLKKERPNATIAPPLDLYAGLSEAFEEFSNLVAQRNPRR